MHDEYSSGETERRIALVKCSKLPLRWEFDSGMGWMPCDWYNRYKNEVGIGKRFCRGSDSLVQQYLAGNVEYKIVDGASVGAFVEQPGGAIRTLVEGDGFVLIYRIKQAEKPPS